MAAGPWITNQQSMGPSGTFEPGIIKWVGLFAIGVGGVLLLFGGFIGIKTETRYGDIWVTNLPMMMIGGVGVLSGVILFVAGLLSVIVLRPAEASTAELTVAYDRQKWNALVKYDDEIALVAEKLQPLGQRWMDEFASSYLALNDKKYLPILAQKIIGNARKEYVANEKKTAHDAHKMPQTAEERVKQTQ